jgi:hypothetical protein
LVGVTRIDLPDDLKNMVKVYLGNCSYKKLFGRNNKRSKNIHKAMVKL